MTFQFYVNVSEKNEVRKTVTAGNSYAGSLRAECDIVNPVIILTGLTSADLSSNYAYISEFGRYYYITGIRSIRNDVWEISCHVDVLYTFRGQITQQEALLKRSAAKWNMYLQDNRVQVQQNPEIATIPFPNGFTAQTYILAVAGA